MGGALIAGLRYTDAPAAEGLMILDPKPGPEALAAAKAGANLNPSDAEIARARTVVLAVKPQIWRAVAADLAPRLGGEAVIVSVAAGVSANDLQAAFGGRRVVRLMPTLAVAIGQGALVLWASDATLAREVEALVAPLGVVIGLLEEDQLHAATGASASGVAYLCAFIEALESAANDAGLSAADSARIARATVCGAAALLSQTGEDPSGLRWRVTSPGGTTQAALNVLIPALRPLMSDVVAAAAARSRELGE